MGESIPNACASSSLPSSSFILICSRSCTEYKSSGKPTSTQYFYFFFSRYKKHPPYTHHHTGSPSLSGIHYSKLLRAWSKTKQCSYAMRIHTEVPFKRKKTQGIVIARLMITLIKSELHHCRKETHASFKWKR